MDAVEVSTEVYASPERVYEFLVDFPGYGRYSEHLDEVRQHGDGGEGTEYDLVFSWWRLTYTARSRVTGMAPPERIDWRIVKDIDAAGYWAIEPLPEDELPDGESEGCVVRLRIEFSPDSADAGAVDLPRFVSISWVIERVKPLIKREAERITRRVVRDLEGRDRPVDLEIHQRPDSV